MGLKQQARPESTSGKWDHMALDGYRARLAQKMDPGTNTTLESIFEMGNINPVSQFRVDENGTLAASAGSG